MKERADKLIYEKGLAPSREKAKVLIMAGEVFVENNRVSKPGEMLDVDSEIVIKGRSLKYVSRGGFKLEKIIQENAIDLGQKICMDIGSSTGGFTDCMLQAGAEKVYAIDVGYNQLDYKLRKDPRVVVMERTNIRNLEKEDIPDTIDFISIDVSFIGLSLVLPKATEFLGEDGMICALVKPQFEAGKEKVGKGGVIRERSTHIEVLENTLDLVKEEGLFVQRLTYSPIKGTTGNIEFLLLLGKREEGSLENINVEEVVDRARKEL
ncbi:TlyA family RNA methyltransferase [Peptoniphilus sp. KCTC 25270]|uniref:TlyA family RNA methyltransferase n=1 Tax=Peptoniphilus sp. KCTC 25270 TaxID=2897414 RepID=UPI001E5DD676|nr:TlyA family RNA methyltransferase [Peptoniphilus sp. KCTC 25270]MCD1147145.1 TlyA family RNA methyltransferase [Peptoniphilus sp. KCTC 25270]